MGIGVPAVSLSGDISSLAKFASALANLPRVVAIKVASAAAPAITAAARATFDAGEDAYGVAWTPSVDGQRVTLRKSGALARGVTYAATGTKLRVQLGVSYARYQLGRRPAFPRQGAPLPESYIDALKSATEQVIAAEVQR